MIKQRTRRRFHQRQDAATKFQPRLLNQIQMKTPATSGAPRDLRDRQRAERRRGEAGQPAWRRYRNYGLRIRSQLALPELCVDRCQPKTAADVDVVLGSVPDRLAGGTAITSWLQVADDRCILDGGEIARYQVEHGSRIIVDRRTKAAQEQAAGERDVRLYLLGTAFGALLHQRQLLPLHLSAVATGAGAIGFTGPSGAGKSTIAAWLHFRFDLPLITDDVAVIDPGSEQPVLHPGPTRLKLWDDAISALGLRRDALVRDLTRTEKFHLPNATETLEKPTPLTHLIVLKKAESPDPARLKEIHGIEAYQAVMNAVYRPGLNKQFYKKGKLHIDAGALARKIRVFNLERPWGLDRNEPILEQLLRQLGVAGGSI